MTVLTRQPATLDGTTPTYVAASAGGDTIPYHPATVLHVKNGGVIAITVTVNSQQACDQGFDHDKTVSVPAGGEKLIGPFSTRFKSPNNDIAVSYSAVASVTVAALEVG